MEIGTIGLLGAVGAKVSDMIDLALIFPHNETPRIQEVHIATSHIICQLVEDDYVQPADKSGMRFFGILIPAVLSSRTRYGGLDI